MNCDKVSCDRMNCNTVRSDTVNCDKVSCDTMNCDKMSYDTMNCDTVSCDTIVRYICHQVPPGAAVAVLSNYSQFYRFIAANKGKTEPHDASNIRRTILKFNPNLYFYKV